MLRRTNLALISGLLCLFIFIVSAQDCDKSKCKGPIRYYEELGCKPNIMDGDCCAVSYDCTHLGRRSKNKCHVNGREYDIGKSLLDKDRSGPCDENCACVKGPKGIAMFSCTQVDCPRIFVNKGCFYRHQLDSCCEGKVVCPKDNGEIEMCEFNGTSYKYGEVFYPNDRHVCMCSKTFTVQELEIICRTVHCGIELRRSFELHENCPPVFLAHQLPSQTCSYEYKCQEDYDKVKSSPITRRKNSRGVSVGIKCKFGNMMMNIGEELSQEHDPTVRCVCEVPPMLTCTKIS
ncbi:uncharacterized protein LOC106641955 [Copidosoma floridanum]|uniref:uncharacterized protein LOC106641955 n=1 Tax=Copidosoma floridanum TaxID=29053 RepID=UPI0006C99B84|nr:uncharacterized protein LOC106641955 [Copidosoma floridanum]